VRLAHGNVQLGRKLPMQVEETAVLKSIEHYLLAAVRYVELGPVHAHMAKSAEDYQWSSARAHLAGEDGKLVTVAPMLERVSDWRNYLECELDEATKQAFRMHGKTGRPLGDEAFLDNIERIAGRALRPQKPGRKKCVK